MPTFSVRSNALGPRRQVQDLERQLAHARQQLSHLRSVPRDAGSMEPAPYQPSSQPVGLETNRSKRPKPGVSEDFLKVRSNLRRYGHGIFRPPRLSHRPLYLEDHPFPLPELPPKHIADELLQYYHTSFHIMFPILRWSSFTGDYEAVYREGSLKNTSPVWMALLFAVFAWGSLNLSMRDGQSYLAISKGVIDRWMEAFELDHVRCAIISSIFMFEINLQSAGWAWLGFTVRIAQDLGLHFESEHWSFTQRDVRRRVWWSIYACDRYAAHKDRTCPCINAPSILSLELERPCMINDEDCEVELPVGPEDDNTEFTGSWRPSSTSQPELPFLSTLRVVRETSKLFRILRRSTLSLGELQSLDLQFNRCMAAFPAQHHIRRNEPLDLRSVTPLIYLQNARLVLHRRNLTTACAVDARLAAIDHCTLIAQDTTQLLSRCMMDPLIPQSYRLSNHPGWAVHLRAAANSFLCTHIWRCTLFLCLRGSFEAASVCVRASATIGDARLINLACGRYVDFFLDELTTKLRHEPVAYLDKDEELIAYASGDLQRSIGCSWVWHAGGGVHRQPSHSPMTVDPRADEGTATAGADEYRSFSQADWDGLLEKLSRLSQEQQPREDRRPKAAHGFPPGATGEPIPVASTSSSGPLPGLPSSSSRISIADIM